MVNPNHEGRNKMEITKTCSKCKETKELSEFYEGRAKCKVCRASYKKVWKETNKEREEVNNKSWRKAKTHMKVYMKTYMKVYMKTRKETDPFFKFTQNLRSRISNSLKHQGYSKKSKACQILGADFNTTWEHLKCTWLTNYGTELQDTDHYHIDHVIPISSAMSEEHALQLNHYTNLQLLTPEDNMKKGDSLTLS
jgi:uncharacterized Zn finger protein (UPF0148 family)